MAGFMAGFGKAFSEAYAAGKQRKFTEEQNSIERDFQKAMKEQEFLYQQKLEDKRAAREAERFARQLEIDRQNAEATRQFQMKMAEDNRQHDMNMSTANRTWEFLDDSAKERAALEKEQRERGYKVEDDKSALELYKEKDKIDTESAITLEKTKRGLDNEEKDIQARSDTNFILETNPELADPDGDGQVDPRVFEQIYGVVRKQGREAMEKMIEEGYTLDFGSDPKKSTDSAAVQNTGAATTSPASQQTDAILASKSQPPVAASSEVAPDSKPLPSTSPWKKADKEDKYDNLGLSDLNNRMKVLESKGQTGSEEYKRLEAMVQGQLAIEAAKSQADASARGQAYTPNSVIVRDDPYGPGRIVPAKNVNGQWFTRDGKPIPNAEPVDQTLSKAIQEAEQKSGPQTKEYQQRYLVIKDGVNVASNMKEVLARNPNANTWGGSIAAAADEYSRDIIAAVDQLGGVVSSVVNNGDPNALPYIDKQVKTIEEQVQGLMNQGIQSDALDKALFESYRLRMTYAILSSVGQDGKAVNKEEFQNVYNDLGNSNPNVVEAKLDEWVQSATNSLGVQYELLNEYNTEIGRVERDFNVKGLSMSVPPETVLEGYKMNVIPDAADGQKLSTKAPEVGTIETDESGGKWEFQGGDPADQKNWRQVK